MKNNRNLQQSVTDIVSKYLRCIFPPSTPEPIKLVAPDGGNLFGFSVGIFNDNVVVGAASASYLFSSDGSVQNKFIDNATGDVSGRRVAISADAVVVGAPKDNDDKGSAFVFPLEDISGVTKIEAPDDENAIEFGVSVAVTKDGFAVGAWFALNENGFSTGAVYFFDSEGFSKLTGTGDSGFGYSIALTEEVIVVGDALSSFFIYNIQTGEVTVIVGGGVGGDVAVFGDKIVIGIVDDNDNGEAYIYALDGTLVRELVAPDGGVGDTFGWSVAVSEDRIAVGAPGDKIFTGAVHLFKIDGEYKEKLVAPNGQAEDYFGYDVSISGKMLVTGAPQNNPRTGFAYLFDLS